MLIALVLLASIDSAPSPAVTMVLSGTPGATPVSATPRSLSDVARELREGRKAVGGFSAVETTVPRNLASRSVASLGPPDDFEPDEPESEPEVVVAQPPAYNPGYYPSGYGGYLPRRTLLPRSRVHVSAPSAGQSRHAMAGRSRQIR